LPRGDVARLAVQDVAFRERVARLRCRSGEDARSLALFAYRCITETPLQAGTTPLSLLEGHPTIQQGVQLVGRWLAGEAIDDAHLEQTWSSARREADTHSKDMVGAQAAQWAAIAAIEAARCARASRVKHAEVVESAAAAALYARAAGVSPTWESLQFQINIAEPLAQGE
jgi:hypothetical protein